MNPIIAKRWEATHAPDDMAACAPAAVDSSRHGRTAGYRTNITPASARARAPRRVRVAVVAIGDSVRGDMAAVKHLDRVSRNRGPRTSHSQCGVGPSVTPRPVAKVRGTPGPLPWLPAGTSSGWHPHGHAGHPRRGGVTDPHPAPPRRRRGGRSPV